MLSIHFISGASSLSMSELVLKQYFSPEMISSLSEAASAYFFVLLLLFIYQKTPSVILLSNILIIFLNHSSLYIPAGWPVSLFGVLLFKFCLEVGYWGYSSLNHSKVLHPQYCWREVMLLGLVTWNWSGVWTPISDSCCHGVQQGWSSQSKSSGW
jgi:hypothetical protein